MFDCPVCDHATFNVFQYTVKSGVSTVECSNCHTVLHQPPRLRNMLVALPLLFMPLAHRMGWSFSGSVEWYLLAAAASVMLGLGVLLTRLEPVATDGSQGHPSP